MWSSCLPADSVGDRKVAPPAVDPRSAVPEKSLPTQASELWDLVRTYAKQETIEPLKGIGRAVGWGLAGSVFVGFGVVLLALGSLRALQDETTAFDGNWSF